jgi:hypothetical protein
LRIQVVIPLWKRPEVTKFCFDELKKLIAETKHEMRVLCVISEGEYIPVCDSYGFIWMYADNNPLGEKINKGIRHALQSKWDYLMMMNSDDVIKSKLIDVYYQPFFEKQEKFFGLNTVTYVNFYTNEAREVNYGYAILGIGKCVRRDVVEEMKGNLYPSDKNKMLDDNMFDRMLKVKAFPRTVAYEGQLAMDFKSDTNIWPWAHFTKKGKAVEYVTD